MWLNSELKAEILLDFVSCIEKNQVDKSMISYLDRINGVDVGVNSIESCSGHYQGLDDRRSEMGRGYVLLAISEDFARRLFADFHFWENIYYFKLVCFYSKHHSRGKELASVRFEFWPSKYEEAMEKIISILEGAGASFWKKEKQTQYIEIEHKKVEIDSELALLIRALNEAGLKTTACCSGHKKYDAYVSIVLDNIRDIGISRDGEYGHKLTIWWNPFTTRPNRKEVVHSEVKD